MAQYRNKRTSNGGWFRRLRTKVVFLLLIFFLVWASIGALKQVRQSQVSKKNIENLKAEILNLEKKNNELRGLIEYFKTDEAIEREARERLNLKKSGEGVIVILDEGLPTSTNPQGGPTGEGGENKLDKPNLIESILHAIFH